MATFNHTSQQELADRSFDLSIESFSQEEPISNFNQERPQFVSFSGGREVPNLISQVTAHLCSPYLVWQRILHLNSLTPNQPSSLVSSFQDPALPQVWRTVGWYESATAARSSFLFILIVIQLGHRTRGRHQVVKQGTVAPTSLRFTTSTRTVISREPYLGNETVFSLANVQSKWLDKSIFFIK